MEFITAVAHTTIEFTFFDTLSDDECLHIITQCYADDIDVHITQSCRIVIFEVDELQDATSILQTCNLIHNIAKIREATEWDIIGFNEEYPLNLITTLESDNDD